MGAPVRRHPTELAYLCATAAAIFAISSSAESAVRHLKVVPQGRFLVTPLAEATSLIQRSPYVIA